MTEALDFVRALGEVDIGARSDVKLASRAIHVRRREDIALHDEVFDAYWRHLGRRTPAPASTELPTDHRAGSDSEEQAAGDQSAGSQPATSGAAASDRAEGAAVVRRTYSAAELLRHRDFDRMTADELREAEKLIDSLAVNLAMRPTRRYELHAHGTRLAPRPMLRRSVATGGELVDWVWARRRVLPRPITLLIDVSGSMESYARLMLRFAHALRRVNPRTEVFVFGTRLTRVTRSLATRRVDDALARVSAEVQDWSGGTRIGESIREYNRRWAGRVASSDGIVVVLSDGWDRGEPALVDREMAKLRRNCRRLLWLNPLAGSPGFQPLAAGMAAAERHVDLLLPAASLADLENFSRLLVHTRATGPREKHAAA
jgi:uncharacterized protein with von Willebrand factor type A (vWA) domain